MFAALKAIFTAIILGGVLVASFYAAYVLLLVTVLAAVGGLSYLYFNRDEIFRKQYFDD